MFGDLLKSVGSSLGMKAVGAKVPAFQPPAIPAQLPKIAAPTAAEIAKSSAPKPEAMALLTPQQTPSQFLGALQEQKMGDEMVKTIAHGLPDREGVAWAAQSAQTVADKLPPADVQALQAAQAWTKTPTAATQAAAAAAAEKAGMTGPGGMAAQAAAWAKPALPAASAPGGAVAPAMRLAPHAVSGAVLLSAAIAANPSAAAPKAVVQAATAAAAQDVPLPTSAPAAPPPTVPPEIQAQTFKEQHPYIASGIDFATGKTPV